MPMTDPTPHGPWKILASREVYQDPWIALRRDEVIRPDGNPGTHCVVRLKAGVSVLAVDDDEMVYLTEEFHYGVGRTTLELVSGGIESDEDALLSARRELQEETGLMAARWTALGSILTTPGFCDERIHLFLARELSETTAALEDDEAEHEDGAARVAAD